MSHAAILNARQLDRPDGRPLCRYDVTDAELGALVARLSERGPDAPDVAADFCLAAAELWRRRYDGGLWTFDVILPFLGWTALSAPDLTPLIRRGLTFWRRPLLQLARREYLGSLAREAGLPTSVLKNDASRIRTFLGALIDDLRTFGPERATDLATARGKLLPKRMRNATFRDLAIEIALAAIALADIARQRHTEQVTAPALDALDPGWRARFPVRLDDDAALALITGLVAAAAIPDPPRPLRVAVTLTGPADAPRLIRALVLPKSIPANALASAAAIDGALPARIDLLEAHPAGAIPLAWLVRRADGTYRPEPLTDLRLAAAPSAPVTLALRAQGHILGHLTPPGGDALCDDLPWTFAPTAADADVWRLAGQGSARFASRARALLPPGSTLTPPSPALGALGDRSVHDLTATSTVTLTDGTTLTIHAGLAPTDDAFVVSGARLPEDLAPGQTIFIGPPTIARVDAEGVRYDIPAARVRARTPSDKAWGSLPPYPLGPLHVRVHDEQGGVVFDTRVACLPPGTSIELAPIDAHSGRVTLGGDARRQLQLGVPSAPELTVTHESTCVATVAAPTSVTALVLEIRGVGDRRLTLTVPFPRRGRRFATPHGDPLGDTIGLDALHTAVAEAWADPPRYTPTFWLEARVKAHDITPVTIDLATLRPGANGRRHVLPLHAVARQLERMLALSSTSGAEVRLQIRDAKGGSTASPQLQISEFADRVTFERDDRTRVFAPADLTLQALRIAVPDEIIDLPRTDSPDGLTYLRPIEDRPGSWMIQALRDGKLAATPALRVVAPVPTPDDPLLAAVELPKHELRAAAFHEAFVLLADDAGAPSWGYVKMLLGLLDVYPASLFEALRALPRVPAALALTLLSAPEPAAVVKAFEALPFHWTTFPVAAMTRAIAAKRAEYPSLDDAAWIIVAQGLIEPVAAPLIHRYPGFGVYFAAVRERFTDLHDARTEAAQSLQLTRAMPQFAIDELGRAVDELRQRNQDVEYWPRPQPLIALAERVGAPSAASGPAWTRLREHHLEMATAPLLAAACAATGVQPTPEQAFALRVAESFDPAYFAEAHAIALTLAIAADPTIGALP